MRLLGTKLWYPWCKKQTWGPGVRSDRITVQTMAKFASENFKNPLYPHLEIASLHGINVAFLWNPSWDHTCRNLFSPRFFSFICSLLLHLLTDCLRPDCRLIPEMRFRTTLLTHLPLSLVPTVGRLWRIILVHATAFPLSRPSRLCTFLQR